MKAITYHNRFGLASNLGILFKKGCAPIKNFQPEKNMGRRLFPVGEKETPAVFAEHDSFPVLRKAAGEKIAMIFLLHHFT